MTRKIKYIWITLVLIFSFGTIAYASNSVSYFSPFPKDVTVYYSKAEIGIKLVLNGNTLSTIDMRIDGNQVESDYDNERQMILYRPAAPLSSGIHHITLNVYLRGWSNHLTEEWLFTVSQNAVDSFQPNSDLQTEVLEYMNGFRAQMGLSLLELNDSLNAAAEAHTNYMINHEEAAHEEYTSEKGYTGTTPMIRARAQGYSGISVSENVSSGFPYTFNALDEMIAAPYHRFSWINPYNQDAGYYGKNSFHTVCFGTYSYGSDSLIVYPYNNQTGVPFIWKDTEEPDPLQDKEDDRVGYPITVSYFSKGGVKGLQLKSVSVKDENGHLVDTYINTYENDNNLTDSIILIPKDPLERIEKYAVNALVNVIFEDGRQKNMTVDFSFKTTGFKDNYFDDIANSWAKETINELAKKGIVSGFTEYSYFPDLFISRADFCEFAVNMLRTELKPYEGLFTDVNSTMADATRIEAAKRIGIINGYADGSFKPKQGISREEIATLVKRIYEKETNKTVDASSKNIYYKDSANISSWALGGVKASNELGILTGNPDGSFYPKKKTTRAEAAVIIDRLQDKLADDNI